MRLVGSSVGVDAVDRKKLQRVAKARLKDAKPCSDENGGPVPTT